MTVATIHDLNERNPSNDLQFIIGAVGHLIGVFIIAIVIGEVSKMYNKRDFYKLLDRLQT